MQNIIKSRKTANFSISGNAVLSLVLLFSIAFSIVNVISAAGVIPDPGHDWAEIGNVSITVAQGGTGLAAIGGADQVLGVDAAGTVLEYKTIDKNFIGLGNVENTTLSTWIGSSNITTLGTVSTGVWNGTVIDAVYGGTGLSALGAANQILSMKSDGTALEYKTLDTSIVPENGNLYFTDARADARAVAQIALLKGMASGLAELDGSGKVPLAQIPASLIGNVNYQGAWDAAGNIPALASATGNKGDYYVVGTSGSTALDAVSDWSVGDWAIFNGTAWEKVKNTDSVSSVNGKTGAVSLIPSDIGMDTWVGTSAITTLGTIASGIWNGTVIDIVHGGTGASTSSTAFLALSPLSAKGDLISFDSSNPVSLPVGTDNQILTADSSTSTGLKWADKPTFVIANSPGVAVANSANIYGSFMGGNFDLTEPKKHLVMPMGGTISNFYVSTGSAQTAAGSMVLTVLKNGVPTAITATIPAGAAAGTFSDTTNSVTVSAGDTLGINLVNNAPANGAWVSSYSVILQ